MVDEDFVMGYVCGFNDGSGGGGSGGSPIPDLVLDNVYYFGSSEYGVGTINYAKSNFYRLSDVADWVISPGPSGPGSRVYGPPTRKEYYWGYARIKGDSIIGIAMGNLTCAVENTEWSYETGTWVKTSGTSPVFGDCRIVKTDDSTEYHEKYQMVLTVDGVELKLDFASRSMDEYGWDASFWYGGSSAQLMTDSDYTAWITALSKNGITLEEVYHV